MQILMFHSIGIPDLIRKPQLSLSLDHFINFCKFLHHKEYRTLLLDEYYHLIKNPKEQTGNELILTFDDGYLDNWVYAYPIMKKYGLKGTVFINPEFVDPATKLRPNIQDVWTARIKKKELKTLGFLSWPEIQMMDVDGILQAQSHSMSHNSYFHSNQLIDFYLGQPDFYWLAWFFNPDRKTYYLNEDQSKFIPYGYPIFQYDRALGLRRFIPDKKFIETLQKETELLRVHSDDPNLIKKELNRFSNYYFEEFGSYGRFETDEELEIRYRYELINSKRILEERVNHEVNFLCWPGGSYNELSQKIAAEAGYIGSTLGNPKNINLMNQVGPQERMARKGFGSHYPIRGKWILSKNKHYLTDQFRALNKSLFAKLKINIEFTVFKLINP